MNLTIQTIVSIVSAALTILIFLKDVFNMKKQLKMESLKLNYKYKLECMSNLVSLYMRKDYLNPDAANEQFHSLTVTAQLLCSHKTIISLETLHNVYLNIGIHSKEFADAYDACLKSMRKDLDTND